jgi:hypothetical protein
MVVPLSKLDHYVAETILAIQRGLAHCAAQGTPVSTDPPEAVTFQIQVIDDTAAPRQAGETQSLQPDSTQVQSTGIDSSTSTTTQAAQTSEETQVQTPGAEISNQAFGRSTTTDTSETS